MTTYSGATVDVLHALGLDPTVDGPLIEWHDPDPDDPTAWTVNPDRSHGLIAYATTYGRADVRSKVPPAQVTLKAARAAAGDAPELGDRFRIALCAAAAAVLDMTEDQAARFTGEVSDVTLDQAGRTWTAIGVGTLPRKARKALDLTLAGTAAASDRWTAIIAALGLAGDDVDDTPVLLAAPDAPAAGSSMLDSVADSTLGQTVQDLDGGIDWHNPQHRRGTDPVIVLDASEILSAITWAKHVGSVVNIATINYVGGSVTVVDHASVDARGEYPITVTTALTNAGDAHGLGVLLVGRFGTPAWDLPTLSVDVARTVDVAHLADLLKLRHADRLTLTGLPDDGPIAGAFDFYAEGFSEQADRFAWRLGLAVSDPSLSGVSIRWIDVEAPAFPPITVDGGDVAAAGPYALELDGGDASATGGTDLAWSDVYPDIRWFDVARIEDPADLGPYTRTYDGGLAA